MKKFIVETVQAIFSTPMQRSRRGSDANCGLLAFRCTLLTLLTLGFLSSVAMAQEPLVVDPSGNVSIAKTLSVTGNANVGTLNFGNSMGDKISLFGKTGSSNYGFSIANHALQIHTDTSEAAIVFGYLGGTTFTEAMRILGTGNVGIGNSDPKVRLDVVAGGARTAESAFKPTASGVYITGDFGDGQSGIEFRATNQTQGIGFGYNSIYATGSNTDQNLNLLPRGTGKVGIGTKDPKSKLDVAGDMQVGSNPIKFTSVWSAFPESDNAKNRAEISNDTGVYKSLMIVGNRSNGGVRTVSIWDRLKISGPLVVAGKIWTNENGEWRHVGTNGTYKSQPAFESDVRLKKDMAPIHSPLESIRRLNGVTYQWNDEAMKFFTKDIETTVMAAPDATAEQNQTVWQTERRKQYQELSNTQVGVIAQEVEAVLPQAVATDAGGYKTVRYYELIPLVIEALKEEDKLTQEQAKTIASQQSEIQRLTVANQAAQKQLNAMQEVKQKVENLEASMNRLMAEERSADKKELNATGQTAAQSLPSGSE